MHLRLVHGAFLVASHRLSSHLQFKKKGDVRCSTGFPRGRLAVLFMRHLAVDWSSSLFKQCLVLHFSCITYYVVWFFFQHQVCDIVSITCRLRCSLIWQSYYGFSRGPDRCDVRGVYFHILRGVEFSPPCASSIRCVSFCFSPWNGYQLVADLLLVPYDSTLNRGLNNRKIGLTQGFWRFSDHHPDKLDLKVRNILVQTALYQPYYGVGD